MKLHVRICPVCQEEFTSRPAVRRIYCSPYCRREAENLRERERDEARAVRLGETQPLARGTKSVPRPLATAELPPAATRNSPHCDQPVTIVALLATPEAARPTIPAPVPDIVSIRRA
ncbi:hypothetical protein ABT272_39470 [Streptomyces sp900105245]|uniref:Uncharacterized protein n=1 Tax=Streptomyces sp. 900105245 TaxID=3154379 RepID=A0ABV1UJM9_9ACTN